MTFNIVIYSVNMSNMLNISNTTIKPNIHVVCWLCLLQDTDEHTQFFSNLERSVMNLLVLLTTANNPDGTLPINVYFINFYMQNALVLVVCILFYLLCPLETLCVQIHVTFSSQRHPTTSHNFVVCSVGGNCSLLKHLTNETLQLKQRCNKCNIIQN